MIKFVFYFYLLVISIDAYALSNPKSLDSFYLDAVDIIEKNTIDNKFSYELNLKNNTISNQVLNDQKNVVSDEFEITAYFRPIVEFWFSIYTQFNSKQIVIHDIENVNIIYKIMDFSNLHNSNINIFAAFHLQNKIAKENTSSIKKTLRELATKNFKYLNQNDLAIINTLKKANVKIPSNKGKRKILFESLNQNIRAQTGQRDMIFQGVTNSLKFMPFILKQFDNFKIPHELVALAFLESSFNTMAYSKAGASGVWQFIKSTGNVFMPKIGEHHDYRNNIFISSVAALHLLQENKKLLKSWDLAITAYNSGTKHIFLAKKKFKKKKDFNLEFILKNYSHKHLGFASKNYYAEFLALVYVLAYKDVLYPLKGIDDPNISFNPEAVELYISKCSFIPKNIAKYIKKSSPDFLKMNSHFDNFDKKFPRGTLIASDLHLTSRKYYKVSDEEIKKMRPHHWPTLIKNLKCN